MIILPQIEYLRRKNGTKFVITAGTSNDSMKHKRNATYIFEYNDSNEIQYTAPRSSSPLHNSLKNQAYWLIKIRVLQSGTG